MNWFAMRVAPDQADEGVVALMDVIGQPSDGVRHAVCREGYVAVPIQADVDAALLLRLNRVRVKFSTAPGAVLSDAQMDLLERGDWALPETTPELRSLRGGFLRVVFFLLALVALGSLWLSSRTPKAVPDTPSKGP